MKREPIVNGARKSNWAEMPDQEVLDYDAVSLHYNERLKYRERLQQIRKRDGWQVAYIKDIWPEHHLTLFLDETENVLDPGQMLFQEKAEYVRRLHKSVMKAHKAGDSSKESERLDEFYDKYWDWEIDETEQIRRYKGESSKDPITNSPAGGKIEHLNSGSRKGSLSLAYSTPENKRTEEQKKILGFVDSLPIDVKVLDLGCGVGSSFVKGLQELGKLKPLNRTNIDLDPKNIDVFKKYPETKVGISLVADAREIPLPEQSQDLIVCNMMLADNYLNHRDQRQILNEIVRVLKKGGYLVGSIGFAESVVGEFFSKVDLSGVQIYQKK